MKKAIIPILVVAVMAVVICFVVKYSSNKETTGSDKAKEENQKTENVSPSESKNVSDYYGTYQVTEFIFMPSYSSFSLNLDDAKKLQVVLDGNGIKVTTKEATEQLDFKREVAGPFNYLDIIRNEANNYGFIPAYGYDTIFYIPEVDAKNYPKFAELLGKELDTFANGKEQIYVQDGTVYVNLNIYGVYKLEKVD